MSAKMTDEEKMLRRKRKYIATDAVKAISASHKSMTACTDTDCPFCHRGLCSKSECFKDKDETMRVKMPRQIAEDIEEMYRLTKLRCEALMDEVATLIGMDLAQFKIYRQEQSAMQRYLKAVTRLEQEHKRKINLNKKVEDIARPEMTVTIEGCIPSPEATAKAIKTYMTSVDFEEWHAEQMREAEKECDDLKRKTNALCIDLHIAAQAECDAMKKRMELECQVMKNDAVKYVQVGERIAANVDEIKRVLNSIIQEPDASVKTPAKPKAEPKKRGRKKKVVDPVAEQMEAGV